MSGLVSRLGLVIAKKWIAGTTEQDALKRAELLNSDNEVSTINYLGEDVKDKNVINKTINIYFDLIKKIRAMRLRAELSMKPTQLGLALGKALFHENYTKIVEYADANRVFVWLDAEESYTIDDMLDVYLRVLNQHKNIGVCVQSRLKRSYSEVMQLSLHNAIIRLVKGAYKENDEVAFQTYAGTTSNYERIMKFLFKECNKFMIATHDERMIDEALRLEKRYKKKAMFGMLNGIRSSRAYELARKKEEVHLYTPFGEEWLPYALRRLKEWRNLKLLLQSI